MVIQRKKLREKVINYDHTVVWCCGNFVQLLGIVLKTNFLYPVQMDTKKLFLYIRDHQVARWHDMCRLGYILPN